MKFRSLLIANRGEIALRVMRTAKRLGLRTIAVYSDADQEAPHVRAADAAVHIGGSSPKDSYLSIKSVLRADGEAVHPGYGFLSENPDFAEAVQKAGRVWVGPPPAAIRAMGDKANAKAIAAKAGVPVLPTYDKNPEFPLIIKALAGGGGRGMRLVKSREELDPALKSAQSEAEHAFGDGRVLLEKALLKPRHVEVQVFADSKGNCIHLGERDCSVQRRHQKLIEESPSPAVDPKLRNAMGEAAVSAARAVGYIGAGTVEFLLEDGKFWFMEMNTRLQVEHPVTELVTGLDLVEWQLRVAMGEPLPLQQEEIRFQGHAIEARLCAEDPQRDFLPQAGRLSLWCPAPDVRTDHALESGTEISPHYDSMIAKVIAHDETRDAAREKLARALDRTVALGVRTNRQFLAHVLRLREFAAGGATTALLGSVRAPSSAASEDWSANAVAAAIHVADLEREAGRGEWSGWSNNPAHFARVRLRGGVGQDVKLGWSNGAFVAKAGNLESRIRVIELAPGEAVIEQTPGHPERVPWCRDASLLHLRYLRRDWTFEEATHRPAMRRAGAAGDALLAPMNGRVVAVHAAPGQSVEAGAALVVLEAMKMEHTLAAPAKLKVKAVHVAAGAQVAPGKLLVEFEAAA